MASSPYLSERALGCYKACPIPSDPSCSPFDPACTPDTCTQLRRDRWNVLKDDPCQRLPTTLHPCGPLTKAMKDLREICVPPTWGRYQSLYTKDFKVPKSHNDIDDCCTAPCPCIEKFPEIPGNLHYRCTEPMSCEPMDCCTTYRHFYTPKPLPPKHPKRVQVYDPCPGPMERCTITRTDYTAKKPIPTGPALSEVIKHGLWSTEQFCKPFSDETTTEVEYPPKCTEIPCPYRPRHNLKIPRCPSSTDTENTVEFTQKPIDNPCFPAWISNDVWYAPETNLEKCTTYNHFYRPYPILNPIQSLKVGSPGAIPFSTVNQLWYSCFDPKPNQKTPVEARDNDPWPYVKPCPIKYQDNLQTDPCAAFCDDTIYKCDYVPKALCRPNESYRPIPGDVPPLLPFNDDTTMKVSYPAYNWCQYKDSFGNAGNPDGVNWGPFKCPPEPDKCLPRFPAPYGHPLKPYLTPNRCPCGPFDNRSTYNTGFAFRSPEVLRKMEADMCRVPNVPKGISLYQHDYVPQGGKKAAVMPPPIPTGYRCMHPCERRDNDTLYRIDYHDFWKSMERSNLELYRGHPTTRTRRAEIPEEVEEQEVIYTPVCIPKPKPPSPFPLKGSPYEFVDLQSPAFRRCREIPYSGEDILNRAQTTEMCSGYQ